MTDLPKAILFDLDDTIITAGLRPAVLLQLAGEYAEHIAPLSPAELGDRLEAAFAEFWSDPIRHKAARFDLAGARQSVIAEVFARSGAAGLTPEFAERFAAHFHVAREENEIYPNARETIVELKSRGVLLALVTNGVAATQRAKIFRFDLAPLFDHIQIEGEHGFGKPEERAYLHAMQALGVEAADTWMVGDHLEWEVAAPQRLGIYAIWHDPHGLGLPAGSLIRPDRIIRSIAELVDQPTP